MGIEKKGPISWGHTCVKTCRMAQFPIVWGVVHIDSGDWWRQGAGDTGFVYMWTCSGGVKAE